MTPNQGFVVLEQFLGNIPYDDIPPGWRVEGCPLAVRIKRSDAVRFLETHLAEEEHTILWQKFHNDLWPIYHTVYTFNDGQKNYRFWYIYG